MKYNFDEVISRENTASIKWDVVAEDNGVKALPYWIADLDFKAPIEVIEALKERIEHGIFGYTAYSKTLIPTVKNWISKRYDWNIEDEWISYTPGIVSAILYAIECFTKAGDSILVQTPVYPPFLQVPTDNNRKIIENNMILNNGKYEIDFKDFEKKAKNAKLFLLSNPHNPSGRVFTKEELEKLGNICVKNNVLIVADEIHSDIIYKGYKHTPIASLSEEIKNITIACYSASKTFSLAGLATSIIVIPNKEIRDRFNEYLSVRHISVNVLGKVALEAAYQYGEDYLSELMNYLESNRGFLIDYMNKYTPKIKPIKAEGTYLIWLDCRELNLNDEELKKFFKKAGVELNSGYTFGDAGKGFMRFNIGCPRETLVKGLERIKNAYN